MGAMTRILLDTHVVLWWLQGDERLRPAARAELERDDLAVLVSAASGWEIATKHRLGKLPLPEGFLANLPRHLAGQRFEVLDVSLVHALSAGSLPGAHRDPFDRMIAAQALSEGLPVMSADAALDAFGVRRVEA